VPLERLSGNVREGRSLPGSSPLSLLGLCRLLLQFTVNELLARMVICLSPI